MRRASFVLALAGGLAGSMLGARPAVAQETAEARACAPFSHIQTYRGWGPADAYGRTVTVSYRATRCTTDAGSALQVVMEGTADIHSGGRLIDRSPFTVSGTWVGARNPAGWPLPWWRCGVTSADYVWRISRYSFSVSVRNGLWTVGVDVPGTAEDVHWAYQAC